MIKKLEHINYRTDSVISHGDFKRMTLNLYF